MFSLPSLAPRDSYTLWYTSSNHQPAQLHEPIDHTTSLSSQNPNSNPASHRRHALHRTPLARLRLDEEYIERRKANVSNYGSSWIKPPGIPKSLYQLREEKREMEEHQEALRREALAQELADAEAEGMEDLLVGEIEGVVDGEGAEDMEGGGRDLDDEVPEADTTGIEAEDEDEDEDEDEGDGSEEEGEVPRGVLASRMPEHVYRDALVRGEQARTAGFGEDSGSTIEEEDASQMLQEEDLVHESRAGDERDLMDLDADLDADIPEAESAGGYEHTDTEEELSSSEEDDSSEEGQGILGSRRVDAASSMVRSDGTQNSMDLSSIMSRSSQNGSSPHQRAGFDRRRSRQ